MEQYNLLKDEDSFYDVGAEYHARCTIWKRLKAAMPSMMLFVALIASITYSTILTISLHHKEKDIERSTYSGLKYDTPTVYHAKTDYQSANKTLSSTLWDSIDTSPIGIVMTNEDAQSHGIPLGSPFPWDDSKTTYYVKVFHHLHCLKNMRKFTLDTIEGVESIISWEHYDHCLDALRQDIMCRADDTPMYAKKGQHVGDGQVSMCRDWDKLIAWTQSRDRHACFHMIDDYKPIKHNLERFAFCPTDSPYYEVSQAYFERWGHDDPFVE